MILGIDLGTTHSLVSVWRNGRVELIPNALGGYLTPSCVGLDEDGSILVGNAARDRLQTHPEKTASLFKRHMGSAKLERLGNIDYRPEELSSLVLRALKEDAETFLGTSVTEAVITVPAYFSDSQRKATRSAGQLAGLKVDRLLSEPTAAALAYGLHEAGDEAKFLVFDLGGGTFDVSIIEKFDGVMEVRAAAGDNFLGGEDFTMVIVEFFYRNSGIAEAARHDVAFQHRLTAQAEATKRALSQRKSDTLSVVWRDATYAVTLTDEQLAALSQDLLTRLRVPVERALRDARIRATDIDSVVLAGGATRMPLIRQLVARMFGRFPHTEVHPDEVVAAGAAVMAGLKMKDAALDEIVMTDVCPYTLSTEVSRRLDDGSLLRGLSSPIIERNTIVPASRMETFYPTEDGQQSLMFGIYQGESRYAKDNIKLGELSVGIAKGPRSEGAVDIRFTYDVNGLLEVETRVHKTGNTDRLLIKSQGDGLSDSEVEERLRALADLKIHPRDRMENRSLQAQAERQFQQLLGPLRDKLGDEIARFEAALAQQDNRASRLASERLRKIMAAIDSDTYFAPDFD